MVVRPWAITPPPASLCGAPHVAAGIPGPIYERGLISSAAPLRYLFGMPRYLLLRTEHGRIVGEPEIIEANDDDTVLEIARRMVTASSGQEVWDGGRLVGGFLPGDEAVPTVSR